MLRAEPTNEKRGLLKKDLACELVVIGGGMAGVCCSITAARAGLEVTLIQDRPVLGGNASSEVRLWILGATSHMGNNNRWAREGGVIDEILAENMYRNREGNPFILDTILLEKVTREPKITLLLNTAVHNLEKSDSDSIRSVQAFCAQNSTEYVVHAPLFCDASGDGILGFMAGAAFRIGAEAQSEFGEKFAPTEPNSKLLGHSIYFYSKDTGRPVGFVPPSYALRDITRIPRYRDFKVNEDGCRLWWIEWGGNLDTVHETEKIKWELWRVAYGVWHYIKNSGDFPESENLTLEWVETIPGKRESRRFEGNYMLVQQDLVGQRRFSDAVSFGGLAIDLHPSDGVFSEQPGCQQWHSKGVYQIPYRCLYSRNIRNLFLAGRIISASHIAFGSTRVMATCAHSAQAVGMAAALCRRHNLDPIDAGEAPYSTELQRDLLRTGQFIPGVALKDNDDLAAKASLKSSSNLVLAELKDSKATRPLVNAWAMMLPVQPGTMPKVTYTVDISEATELKAELRISSQTSNYTPEVTLDTLKLRLEANKNQRVELDFDAHIDKTCYAFVCLMANPKVSVHLSDKRVTGVLSVVQKFNRAVAKSPRQEPPSDSGIDSFEFWLPERRPGGKNLAVKLEPPLKGFEAEALTNGIARPTSQPNAWVAAFDDRRPWLRLTWPKPQTISRVELTFDNDYDHPMESVLLGHPESVMPFCVTDVIVLDGRQTRQGSSTKPDSRGLLAKLEGNHQTRQVLHFKRPVSTDCLEVQLTRCSNLVPTALFELRCYA